MRDSRSPDLTRWVATNQTPADLIQSASCEALLEFDVLVWDHAIGELLGAVGRNISEGQERSHPYLFMNISTKSLELPKRLMSYVDAFTKEFPSVVFQLPTSGIGQSLVELSQHRRQYPAVRLALGEFGTRHADLLQVSELSLDYLVLHHSTRTRLDAPPLDAAWTGLLHGCSTAGISIIIEGLTAADTDSLRYWYAIGARLFKGDMLCPAVNADWLRANREIRFPALSRFADELAKQHGPEPDPNRPSKSTT